MCFIFRELKSNKILSWKDDHSEVTFLPNRTFIFDREKSCNGCDDKKDTFTTPNIPLMVSEKNARKPGNPLRNKLMQKK